MFYFLLLMTHFYYFFSFFFNHTATTEIYTLSLHDALPISMQQSAHHLRPHRVVAHEGDSSLPRRDRKSTRLNSSHTVISYAVFCLKKKKMSRVFVLSLVTGERKTS